MREVADVVNVLGRDPIREGKDKQVSVRVVIRSPLYFTELCDFKRHSRKLSTRWCLRA